MPDPMPPDDAGASPKRARGGPLRDRNSIEPTPTREKAPDGEPAPSAKTGHSQSTVPDSIRRRFVVVGPRYYLPDGTHAFTDRGKRLTTTSENTEIIQTLVVIAEDRGWRDITVKGSERFRKEAWAAGMAAGLNVRGYRPSELEREQLARRLAERAPGAEREEPEEYANGLPGARRRRRELIIGRLKAHGAAPYKHDPHESMSYFVKLETPEGDRDVWGVDLKRAFEESLSKPDVGDEVGLRAIRQESVTVPGARLDPDGGARGPLDTHRNRWVLESREFFDARAAAARTVRDASIDAKAGTRAHPELVGSYLTLKAAELASKDFKDPTDRERFVASVREVLAQTLERGERLAPVHLKARVRPAPAPTLKREEALAR